MRSGSFALFACAAFALLLAALASGSAGDRKIERTDPRVRVSRAASSVGGLHHVVHELKIDASLDREAPLAGLLKRVGAILKRGTGGLATADDAAGENWPWPRPWGPKRKEPDPDCAITDKDRFYRFVPKLAASLSLSNGSVGSGQAASWPTRCFPATTASARVEGADLVVTITALSEKPPPPPPPPPVLASASSSSHLEGAGARLRGSARPEEAGWPWPWPGGCEDMYLVATTLFWHPVKVEGPGTHEVRVAGAAAAEVAGGTDAVHVFRFCDGQLGTLIGILETIRLFNGGRGVGEKAHVTPDMVRTNLAFLRDHMNWDPLPRVAPAVSVDPALVRSGDAIVALRLDGLDPLIMLGTGAYTGHAAAALWIDGALHVVESQAAWYWPTPHGVIATPWDQWMRQAADADFAVALLPLSEARAAAFDEKEAVAWFESVRGAPYGYRNFLFGWVDTERENLPRPLSPELLAAAFALLDRLRPEVADLMWLQALNKRLGTSGLRTHELYALARERGLSFGQLLAVPERDEWAYSDGPAMVCSSLVVALWKAGGLLGPLADSIQATEFHDRDLYTLAFFDGAGARPLPPACRAAGRPWCQLSGAIEMELPGYNTIEPYARMAERCPSVGPEYPRPAGC
eukprot:tig00000147_g9487.t1